MKPYIQNTQLHLAKQFIQADNSLTQECKIAFLKVQSWQFASNTPEIGKAYLMEAASMINGRMVDAYYFCIGGSVGQFASIARPVGYRCAASDVPDAIERLLAGFEESREQGENLRHFLARHSNEDIREILAGSYVVPVERDLTLGAVPQGVEG